MMRTKKIISFGVLLLAVFAMAAVYEFVAIPETIDDEPINVAYTKLIRYPVLPKTPCQEFGFDCECTIEFKPYSQGYKELLKLLKSRPIGPRNSDHSDMHSQILYIWRGSDKHILGKDRELWEVTTGGNIIYTDRTNSDFDPGFYYLDEDTILLLKQILENNSNGSLSNCTEDQIRYPQPLPKSIELYDTVFYENYFDQYR